MRQYKITPALVIGILLLSSLIPMLLAGYSSLQRAEAAQRNAEYALAAETYAHASRFLFWRSDLKEQAGISYARAGDHLSSIKQFEQVEIHTEEGWLWFCTAYIQVEDHQQAIATCTEGTKTHNSARLYQLLAYIHRTQKDWLAEKDALEQQTQLNPADAYAAYRLGLLLSFYSPEAALPYLTRASTLNPEVDSAVQTLRAALAVADQQEDPAMQMVIIGQAFGLLQDWELAFSAFEQAVQRDEKNAEAWAWLGEAKQQLGQDGSAELDQALSLNRASINVRVLRGLYWSRLSDYEKMLAEYKAAEKIEPGNPHWQVGMGEAYSKLGDLVAALQAYQRAVELAPQEAEYWRLLAIFCAENSVQVEEIGLNAAQQALALKPGDPGVYDTLGYVYLSTGRYASAEEALKQAVTLDPQYFSAHIHLALTYLAKGDKAGAYNTLTYVRDAPSAGVYAETALQLLDKYFQ